MQDSTPVKREDAKAFCDCCEWLHKCWSLCLAVDDVAKRHESLPNLSFWKSPAGQFLEHHGMICNEYTLLQFAKLHDRPSVGGNRNLVIDHFTQRDDWPKKGWVEIERISRRLDEFIERTSRTSGTRSLPTVIWKPSGTTRFLDSSARRKVRHTFATWASLPAWSGRSGSARSSPPTKERHGHSTSRRTGRLAASARQWPKGPSFASSSATGS